MSDALLFGLDRPVRLRGCDREGCSEAGLYRAPKDRKQLTSYYWFCLDHVRDYNAKWDYYAGMSEDEIEKHIRFDTCWQRTTWPLGGAKKAEENIRQHVKREFFEEDASFSRTQTRHEPDIPDTVMEALNELELAPPIEFVKIKAHYKKLVKIHHPDANGGSREAEEKFKRINQAFALLRGLYATDTVA